MKKQLKRPSRLGMTAAASALTTLLVAGPSAADTVLTTANGIIKNSLCVGFDCTNPENYGSDTIRMKENNTRLHFMDTSVAPFPTTDWRIEANSSQSGGQNYLAIQDADVARNILLVEGGSPSNSVYVDSTGRVGFRTSTPVLDLHVATGNTPGLRLEQNTSSGFSAQTWDIAGNEANFFIRDVTSGSRLPLRIRPGAPTSSLDISATGSVGLGTASPSAPLHLRRTDGAAQMMIEEASTTSAGRTMLVIANNGNPRMEMSNTGGPTTWQMIAGASFTLRHVQQNINAIIANPNGDVTVGGTLTTSGPTCSGGCDLVFDGGYPLPSIREHAALMWEKRHLPAVGPTSPREPFNVTEKVGGMLNELEKAHIYIAELEERVAKLEAAAGR